MIPLTITNRARDEIAGVGADVRHANRMVLADLADGWTLVRLSNPSQQAVRLLGREHAYVAALNGYRLPDGWCVCPRKVKSCRCREKFSPGDCGAVTLTACFPLTPDTRAAALLGDRYTDRFGLNGEDAWGNAWAAELAERWTRVHARWRRPAEEDVVDLWHDVLALQKLLTTHLTRPVPYEAVELDDEGRLLFSLADPKQQVAQRAVYTLPAQDRVQLTVEDVEEGVLRCNVVDRVLDDLRSFADAQLDLDRQLVLDATRTQASLATEQHTLGALEGRTTRNPELLDLLLDPRFAREDLWLEVDETPIQEKLDENQHDAVVTAMKARDVLVVQGPPGTGKTTFIAELVLRHLREHPGDTVLVASQTNHATDHLLQRLHEVDPDLALVRVASEKALEKIDEDVQRFWLDAPTPWETAVRARAGRYRRFLDAQLATGGRDAAATARLLDLQGEYLGTEGPQLERGRILDTAQVVAGTCVGLANDRDVRERSYALAIVEEAGKATPTEALMAMRRAEKAVLVGDVRQLPPTPDDAFSDLLWTASRRPHEIEDAELRDGAVALAAKLEQASEQIESEADRPEPRTVETLFGHLGRLLRAERPQLEVTLTRQYRMASGIAELISECFYEGRLRHGYDDAKRDPRAVAMSKAHVQLLDVEGVERAPLDALGREGKSKQNTKEASRAIRLLKTLEQHAAAAPPPDGKPLSVAVITGYRAQEQLLRSLYEQVELPHLDVDIGVIDRFQGDEAEVVILSLVRTSAPGFMRYRNRVNVAFSRARSLLIVLTSLPEARSGTLGPALRDVLAYVDPLAEGDPRYDMQDREQSR